MENIKDGCPAKIWIYDINIRHDMTIMFDKPDDKAKNIKAVEYVRADLVEKMKGGES